MKKKMICHSKKNKNNMKKFLILMVLFTTITLGACTGGTTETSTETATETHCSTHCESHVETVVE